MRQECDDTEWVATTAAKTATFQRPGEVDNKSGSISGWTGGESGSDVATSWVSQLVGYAFSGTFFTSAGLG